jgi:hypothetical protein
MSNQPRFTSPRVAACVAGLLLIALAAGCTSNSANTPSTAPTAKAAYQIAVSSLSTMAPQGKLLVAQTDGPISATTTTMTWEFLVGDPKSDKVYSVVVANGKAQAQEYAPSTGLSKEEWAKIPDVSAWKIDSDQAIQAATKLYPNGKTARFLPGFVTYIPASAKTATVKPMTWIFNFDPSTKGSAPTSTVEVDLQTGQAAYAK